jgi:hypothetical protein
VRLYDTQAVRAYVADLIANAPRGTQAKLARKLGKPVQTVNKWARRSTCPDQENWPGIEAYFRLEPGTLAGLGGVGEQKLSEVEAAIYDDVGLTEDQRDALLRVYRTYRSVSA